VPSLRGADADVALRMQEPEYRRQLNTRIGSVAFALYAAPEYIQRCKRRGNRLDLASCDYIVWEDAYAYAPVAEWLRKRFGHRRPALVVNSLSAQAAAVRAGWGLAVLPCFLALGQSGLLRILTPDQVVTLPLWMVIDRHRQTTARVLAFGDYLTELFAELAPVLQGTGTRPAPE